MGRRGDEIFQPKLTTYFNLSSRKRNRRRGWQERESINSIKINVDKIKWPFVCVSDALGREKQKQLSLRL